VQGVKDGDEVEVYIRKDEKFQGRTTFAHPLSRRCVSTLPLRFSFSSPNSEAR
jgi:hypothetical protein